LLDSSPYAHRAHHRFRDGTALGEKVADGVRGHLVLLVLDAPLGPPRVPRVRAPPMRSHTFSDGARIAH